MPKKRLIPKLQLLPSKHKEGGMSLVTTVGFDRIIEIGDPISQAKIYEAQMVDELIFVDLAHSKGQESQNLLISVLRSAAEQIFLPLTIGGGIRSVKDIRLLLQNGADKVSVNSHALANPEFILEASQLFGSQCIVISIDYKLDEDGQPRVYGNSGTQKYDLHPVEWARQVQELGAGEILLNSIDHDGKRNGLELDISARICSEASVPVILSGGCGKAAHFIEGFKLAGADAVSAGTFFCFQDQNPMQTRGHLKNAGIPIRTST